METAGRWTAVILTILLMGLVFYGLAVGWFFNPNFWAAYIVLVLVDLAVISYLKRSKQNEK